MCLEKDIVKYKSKRKRQKGIVFRKSDVNIVLENTFYFKKYENKLTIFKIKQAK